MKIDNRDYKGKEVFIGIDVHKKSYVIAATCDDVLVKSWTTKASFVALWEQLRRFFPGANLSSAYEAGFSGFELHRFLEKKGVKSIVVNPGSIALEANSRVKTDKKDAKKISRQLAAGLLRGIYIPSRDEEDKRSLTRGREQVVRRRQAIGNQIKMKLLYIGITVNDARISERLMKEVELLELTPGNKMVLSEMVEAWRTETRRIKRFNEALKEQAKSDELESIYRSAPGVGALSARVLSNEFGDMSRFKNVRELSSSSGLTPSEYSSGEHIRKGHVTRQGSPRVRAIIVEIAWRAIREDKNLRETYEKIKSRRESKKAIVAIARKILMRLRRCLLTKTMWEDLGPLAV